MSIMHTVSRCSTAAVDLSSWLLSAPSSHLDSNYCDYTAIFKSLHWLIPQHDHLFSSQEVPICQADSACFK